MSISKIQSNYPEFTAENIETQNKKITLRSAPEQGDDPLSWSDLDNNFELLRYTINQVVDDLTTIRGEFTYDDEIEEVAGRVLALEQVSSSLRLEALESDVKVLQDIDAENRLTVLETIDSETRLTTLEAIDSDARLTNVEATVANMYSKGESESLFYTKVEAVEVFHTKESMGELFYSKEESDELFYTKSETDSYIGNVNTSLSQGQNLIRSDVDDVMAEHPARDYVRVDVMIKWRTETTEEEITALTGSLSLSYDSDVPFTDYKLYKLPDSPRHDAAYVMPVLKAHDYVEQAEFNGVGARY